VGILARVPLASGLLTGKFNVNTKFETDDHRNFNKRGEAFNIGETFAGLGLEKGVELAGKLNWIAEGRGNMTRAALKWILEHDEISCVIPGFKTVAQVEDNLQTENLSAYTKEEIQKIATFYQEEVRGEIMGAY